MTTLKICGAALLCAAAVPILREMKGMSALLSAAVAIMAAAAAIASICPSVSFLISAAEGTAFESYAAVLLKAIGIGYCTVITADACRGAGADTAASGIELLGRAEILLISLPLITELLSGVAGLI